jgi:hypothetical protein
LTAELSKDGTHYCAVGKPTLCAPAVAGKRLFKLMFDLYFWFDQGLCDDYHEDWDDDIASWHMIQYGICSLYYVCEHRATCPVEGCRTEGCMVVCDPS